jgi:hypothetical protein
VVIEPASFAFVAASALDRIVGYGAPAVALLGARLLTTGLGIAAGRALWLLRPGARGLALAWFACASAAQVLTFLTPYFPSNRPPGTKWLVLAGLLALQAGGAVYLLVSPRVRQLLVASVEAPGHGGTILLVRPGASARR